MKYLFFLLTILSCIPAQTQTPDEIAYKHQISIGPGYNQGYLRDRNFSPLGYSEGGSLFGVRYAKQHQRSRFAINLAYSSGNIKTPVSPHFTTSYILGNLSIAYVREIPPFSNDKLRIYLGPQYSFYIYYLDWEDQDAFSFMATHSLDLAVQGRYQLNDLHRLAAQLSIPVVNLIVRPPYNGNDEELGRNNDEGNVFALITNGSWGSWNKIFAYTLSLQYYYALTQRLDLLIGYENRYQRTEESFSYRHAHNQFTLGLTLTF
ncbi:MAG: hypothetical protein AAF587_04225 [Bacteroidota bacterium]